MLRWSVHLRLSALTSMIFPEKVLQTKTKKQRGISQIYLKCAKHCKIVASSDMRQFCSLIRNIYKSITFNFIFTTKYCLTLQCGDRKLNSWQTDRSCEQYLIKYSVRGLLLNWHDQLCINGKQLAICNHLSILT